MKFRVDNLAMLDCRIEDLAVVAGRILNGATMDLDILKNTIPDR